MFLFTVWPYHPLFSPAITLFFPAITLYNHRPVRFHIVPNHDVSGAEKQGFFQTSRAITQKNIELWREKVVKMWLSETA